MAEPSAGCARRRFATARAQWGGGRAAHARPHSSIAAATAPASATVLLRSLAVCFAAAGDWLAPRAAAPTAARPLSWPRTARAAVAGTPVAGSAARRPRSTAQCALYVSHGSRLSFVAYARAAATAGVADYDNGGVGIAGAARKGSPKPGRTHIVPLAPLWQRPAPASACTCGRACVVRRCCVQRVRLPARSARGRAGIEARLRAVDARIDAVLAEIEAAQSELDAAKASGNKDEVARLSRREEALRKREEALREEKQELLKRERLQLELRKTLLMQSALTAQGARRPGFPLTWFTLCCAVIA